jgi:glycosyltransferase involved in cell wall biosynthesis
VIRLDLISDLYSPSGYSAHAREVIKALAPVTDLRIIDSKHDRSTVKMTPEDTRFYSGLQNKTRQPDVVVQFETPEFFKPVAGVPYIGFTQWETTKIPNTDLNDQPHLNWVKQMNKMSAMWTSCTSAKKAFQSSGVEVPVDVIPGPVDTAFFRPGLPELDITDLVYKDDRLVPREERPVVLGCVAQWTARKNISDLIISVLSAFKKDEVLLLLKTYGSTMAQEHTEGVLKQIQGLRQMVKNPDAPRIVVLTNQMTDEEIARLYSSMDFVVNPSRGEGLCLPLVQGMASGVVPISNGFSAPSDYIEDGVNGYLVNYVMEPAVHMVYNPWYRYDQRWAKIDPQDLIAATSVGIHNLRNRPKDFVTMQQRARETIVNQMRPEQFAANAIVSLERVLNACAV